MDALKSVSNQQLSSNPTEQSATAQIKKSVTFADPLVEKKRVRFAQPIEKVYFFPVPPNPSLKRTISLQDLDSPTPSSRLISIRPLTQGNPQESSISENADRQRPSQEDTLSEMQQYFENLFTPLVMNPPTDKQEHTHFKE